MTAFIRYDAEGNITAHGDMDAAILAEKILAGEPIILADAKPETHYVDLSGSPTLAIKTESLAYLDGATIRNAPVGAILVIGGAWYAIEDADITLSFSLPGEYAVTLYHAPHFPKTFTVSA